MGTLRAREQDSHENVVVTGVPDICGCLSDGAHNGGGLNGQDAYTGRIIPVQTYDMRGNGDGETVGTLTGDHAGRPTDYTPVVAFSCKDYGNGAAENLSPTLRSMEGVKPNGGGQMAIAFERRFVRTSGGQPSVAKGNVEVTNERTGVSSMQVRRLTPRECERLQGLPDDWTLIPWRGKPAAECPDGPRYKGIGNGQTVNVMRWLAERIKKAIAV